MSFVEAIQSGFSNTSTSADARHGRILVLVLFVVLLSIVTNIIDAVISTSGMDPERIRVAGAVPPDWPWASADCMISTSPLVTLLIFIRWSEPSS